MFSASHQHSTTPALRCFASPPPKIEYLHQPRHLPTNILLLTISQLNTHAHHSFKHTQQLASSRCRSHRVLGVGDRVAGHRTLLHCSITYFPGRIRSPRQMSLASCALCLADGLRGAVWQQAWQKYLISGIDRYRCQNRKVLILLIPYRFLVILCPIFKAPANFGAIV